MSALQQLEDAPSASGSEHGPVRPSHSSVRGGGKREEVLVLMEKEFEQLLRSRGGRHASTDEAIFWLVRGLGLFSLVALVLFLFMHDY